MNSPKPQGGDIVEVAPAIEMQRILECPVCRSVPLPPILNCAKGHIICGKCREKVHKCGLCKADFTDSRNFILEEVVLTLKIACEFREQGCAMVLTGRDFKAHVGKCEFRPIECYLKNYDGCPGTCVDLQNYTKHLASVHKMKERQHENGMFSFRCTLTDASKKDLKQQNMEVFKALYCTYQSCHNVKDGIWTGCFLFFEGDAFVLRAFVHEHIFHFVLCIVGSEKDAEKYKVNLRFIPFRPTHDIPSEVLTPVVSIQKSEEEILGNYHGILTKPMALKIFEVKEVENKQKIWLDSVFKISKTKGMLRP